MTSGTFKSFPVSGIWVDRAKRQRRELRGIDELAASIATSGLINPPVIREDGELIAGERRWTAVKKLGWTHVPVQFIEDLSPAELHLVELEENIRRTDLTWQEQCDAMDRYHRLKSEADPEWNLARTAETLGVSSSELSEKLSVAKEIAKGNSRVAEAPKYSTAKGIVQRDKERRKASVAAIVAEKVLEEAPPVREAPLLNLDFREWAKGYSGPQFNFIHCDFPYGVNADKHDQGAHASYGEYEDSFEVYESLIDSLASSMYNVVSESAHLMFWFSMDYYDYTLKELDAMGWRVNPFPLIWMKSDNSGILPDPARGPRRIYETAFLASRGDRKIVQAVANAFAAPNLKRIHTSEKPEAVLRHFFRMFVDEYSTVLDPTCGSANALRVAERAGASRVLGLEANQEFYEKAKEVYFND